MARTKMVATGAFCCYCSTLFLAERFGCEVDGSDDSFSFIPKETVSDEDMKEAIQTFHEPIYGFGKGERKNFVSLVCEKDQDDDALVVYWTRAPSSVILVRTIPTVMEAND